MPGESPSLEMQRLQAAADALERVLNQAGVTINFPVIPAAAVLVAVEQFDREQEQR